MSREQGLRRLRPASMQAWQPKTCTILCMRSLRNQASHPGDLHIHSREEIGSESRIFHGIAGPEVFVGQVERGWQRERGGG